MSEDFQAKPPAPSPTGELSEPTDAADRLHDADGVLSHPAAQLDRSWLEGDKDEQEKALQFLRRVIDEDRLSDRPRFEA